MNDTHTNLTYGAASVVVFLVVVFFVVAFLAVVVFLVVIVWWTRLNAMNAVAAQRSRGGPVAQRCALRRGLCVCRRRVRKRNARARQRPSARARR